jgi:tripartite ATP-independent transporter DctM subunit
LGYVIIFGNGIFGAISGSAGAALVTFGTIAFPRMRQQGYTEGYSVALIASSAMLSLFIPPSMDMIMFGFMARLNIAACFLATVGPGILLMILYSVISFFMTRNMPLVELPKRPFKETMRDIWLQGRRAFFVVIVIPLIILGGIYGGVFTPTEAAGAAVVVAIVIATLVHRSLTMKDTGKAMLEAAYLTGMIMAVLFFMFVFGRLLLWQNIVQSMIIFFSTVSKSIAVQLLMLNILLFIVGMLMDDNSACILSGILLVPVMSQLGVNPYHLAGIVMANLGLGLLTPPVAPLLYAASGVTGVPLKRYFRYSIYFMILANLPVIFLATYIPEICTFLPNLAFGTGLGR